ncbi:Fc.00g108840.m01.CDS01 [Cosmosporella sp. VM-42]
MTTDDTDTLWVAHASEEHEEVDEPPELLRKVPSNNFRRTVIRKPNEQSSLLTKAIMGHSDDDLHVQHHDIMRPILANNHRRRSMTSNISIASTADLTSDTGFTSPSRPNTPSPPVPEMAMLSLASDANEPKNVSLFGNAVRQQVQPQTPKEAPRKRCIQFACAKPIVQEPPRAQPMIKTPSAQEAPRRPCIKFACPARPASTQNTPPGRLDTSMSQALRNGKPESPSTPKKYSALSAAVPVSPRHLTVRRPSMGRPTFLRANSKDLVNDGSHFHEFASGTSREDDWIRHDNSTKMTRLTINDTLTKENHIRRLATEAEEEEELENEDAEAALDEEEDEVDELDGDMDEDEYDDDDGDDDDEDDDSDGYHTDEETGFAASDDEEDDDENMAMWTPSQKTVVHIGSISQLRRPSLHEQHSDDSITTTRSQTSVRRLRSRRIKPRTDTPDLPDSTDFVCGTLDEDRPLEEAYLSCIAARRNEKLRLIPQDIDPSFPASDPENEDEEEIFNPVHRDSDEEEWLHGEMEDLHHEHDRPRRRRKSEHTSPKRYRSPPPKRHHSPPPPRIRGRSPKPLFDRHSPRKPKSPVRKVMTTPLASPKCGQVKFNLAGRPGLTHTKSLPRAGAAFLQLRHSRHTKIPYVDDVHVRGAIDIVKGLEKKRQRRKEKFHQKYCDRARRGQIPERKPLPGRGAERMRELGLLMAGKKDPGNYVLSI